MDGLPWPEITASSGGWVLFGMAVVALLSGRLVTKREADSYLARAEKAETNNETLVATLAELTAVSKLQKAVIDAAITQRSVPIQGDGDGS